MPTERSVIRAAIRPGLYQPAVSASLKRLCALAGHSLLARSGAAMVPTAPQMGARGVMDEHLDKQGLQRNVTGRCPHVGLLPAMVASSWLLMTSGRRYGERVTGELPVTILPRPMEFPRLLSDPLWDACAHASAASKWLRERVKSVAAVL